MIIIFQDLTGKVPENLKKRFQDLIFKSHKTYEGYKDLYERINDSDMFCRINFDFTIDSQLLHIEVKECINHKK